MARPEIQPNPFDVEKDDSDRYPDRSRLPQAPGSQFVSSYPGIGAVLAERRARPTLGGGIFGGGPLISLGFGFSPTSSDETPFRPPDTQGDVSPTQILVAINGRIKVFDRNGTVGTLNTTTDTFFQSVRSAGISDPRVRWDPLLQRWIVIAIDVASTNNRVTIAVSNSATITATSSFNFFFFNQSIGGTSTSEFADYPTLGVDKNALYIGTNQFAGTSGGFLGTEGYVVRKSSLTAGGSPVVTHFNRISANGGLYTPQGVDNDDPAATEGYFVGVSISFQGQLVLRRVSNPGGTPTISANVALTTPATANPIDTPQPGTTATLSTLDTRLFLAKICEGPGGARTLWTSHNIGVNASGVATSANRTATRWYQISGYATGSTPALV
ncbi:MAG: hypothetical protein C4320_00895, partial [Armatimonadota bacterium]